MKKELQSVQQSQKNLVCSIFKMAFSKYKQVGRYSPYLKFVFVSDKLFPVVEIKTYYISLFSKIFVTLIFFNQLMLIKFESLFVTKKFYQEIWGLK